MQREPLFVTVVIPAHNEEQHISDCLAAILDQDYPRSCYEVIVVNNNSTDGTERIALAFGVRVINEPVGPVGKVRNTGANLAKGELLVFLDSDCIAPTDWISYASEKLSSNPNQVLGGGYELRTNPKSLEKYWLLDSRDGAVLPKELLGGTIAISKSAFLQVGGFDETVTSGEDSKLSKTLRQLGLNVVIDRRMSVIHLGNPTDIRSFLQRQIWHSENYILDITKSISDPTFLLVTAFTISLTLSLITAPLNCSVTIFFALIAITIPLIFSIKRIWRSRNPDHLKSILKVYCLDMLYVAGRSVGLLKGVFGKLSLRR